MHQKERNVRYILMSDEDPVTAETRTWCCVGAVEGGAGQGKDGLAEWDDNLMRKG